VHHVAVHELCWPSSENRVKRHEHHDSDILINGDSSEDEEWGETDTSGMFVPLQV